MIFNFLIFIVIFYLYYISMFSPIAKRMMMEGITRRKGGVSKDDGTVIEFQRMVVLNLVV